MKPERESIEIALSYFLVKLVLLLFFVILIIYIGSLFSGYPYNKPQSLNDFADSLSGLFATLAFFGVCFGLYIQRREFLASRKESSDQIKHDKFSSAAPLFIDDLDKFYNSIIEDIDVPSIEIAKKYINEKFNANHYDCSIEKLCNLLSGRDNLYYDLTYIEYLNLEENIDWWPEYKILCITSDLDKLIEYHDKADIVYKLFKEIDGDILFSNQFIKSKKGLLFCSIRDLLVHREVMERIQLRVDEANREFIISLY